MAGYRVIEGNAASWTADLPHAVKSLQCRGPDDEGLWFGLDNRAGLGHRRLSVLDLVINIPKSTAEQGLVNDYLIRRKAADFGIPLVTQPAQRFVESLSRKRVSELHIKSWNEYAPPERAPMRVLPLQEELKSAA